MTNKPSKRVSLHSRHTVSEAIQNLFRHDLNYLVFWEPQARCWEDIEGVHQMRVTLRRMRSALNTFRRAIPRSVSAYWSDEMSELAGQLGRARDLDVFIAETLGMVEGKMPIPGGDRLRVLAETDRALAYDEVCSMLDGSRYQRFKEGFAHWVETRGWEKAELGSKERLVLQGDLVAFARGVLDRQERRVLEVGNHVNKQSAEEMHRLRIEFKKLRYAAEFFSGVFMGMEEFIAHTKGVQDLLGMMNDVAVMSHLLQDLLKAEGSSEVLEYAGGVVGWRTCHYYHLLEDFETLWEEFTEAKHPWWKKSAVIHGDGTPTVAAS